MFGNNKEREDKMERFKNRLTRTKTIKSESSMDLEGQPQLEKCLTTFDLMSLGVGSCCGTGMYVVAGLVAKNVAGPGVIFSFVIAAIASIMSGVCYGEFGVRVPKTSGSAYMYSYVTVGEFVAFLIGWNLILEYIIGSAAGASAISAVIDSLSNYTISDHLETHVGTVIGKTYPDFIGLVIGLIMTAVIAIGVQKSVRMNNVLNLINLIIWVFIFIAGFCYIRGSLWFKYGFLPHGMSGVFSGAATCFYAFIGFDIIATTGEEAKNPSRSIPRAIIGSLIICLIAYITVSIIMTLMVPYFEIEGRSALIDVFGQRGATWAKFIVAIGAVSALTASLLGSMFPAPRVVYAISRDGLLFGFLSRINPRTGTPVIATAICGTLAALMALLVGLQELVEMMSIGTLLAYTLVSISVLILRYQYDPRDLEPAVPMAHKLDTIEEQSSGDNSPSDDNSSGGKVKRTFKTKDDAYLLTPDGQPTTYGSLPIGGSAVQTSWAWVQRHGTILWYRLGLPSDDAIPTQSSGKTVIIITGVLVVLQTACCLLIVFGEDFLARGAWWAVIILLAFIVVIVACVFLILRQPQSNRKLDFMAPGVPFLPCCAMFVNIYLMLKLPVLTWVRLGVWLGVGLLLYFSYGMWNSVKERRLKARQSESEPQKGDESYQQTNIDSDDVFENSKEKSKENALTPPGGPTSNHKPATNDPWRPQNTTSSTNDPWTPKPAASLNGDPWSLR